ncbi:hypothetical protein CH63R_02254 [Colletotrichum higginsianum IMI 349063]|uniref:Uncharacterized protein n=1 Tax=Colletotrichum higginsianum (strain IMI 349063) TaxID=759273 RepID=A0A1B7YNS4_COLHI|nr:hypothetical protein CH63R_02254 [Colletotrichum higginsianum IMI 349063]OBR13528.1 hypothetical protein CH63R_02254 [Colletotrichum higginsianum IMI 349063]
MCDRGYIIVFSARQFHASEQEPELPSPKGQKPLSITSPAPDTTAQELDRQRRVFKQRAARLDSDSMHCKALLCILVLPCAVRGATVSRTSALTTTALQEAQFVPAVDPSLCSLTPTIPLPSFDSQHSPATQAGFIAPDASCPFCLHSTQYSTSAEAPTTNDHFGGGFDGQCFARQYETEPNRRFSSIWLQSWGSESLTAACNSAYLVTNPMLDLAELPSVDSIGPTTSHSSVLPHAAMPHANPIFRDWWITVASGYPVDTYRPKTIPSPNAYNHATLCEYVPVVKDPFAMPSGLLQPTPANAGFIPFPKLAPNPLFFPSCRDAQRPFPPPQVRMPSYLASPGLVLWLSNDVRVAFAERIRLRRVAGIILVAATAPHVTLLYPS